METVWILLWASTSTFFGSYSVKEWRDNYSIRSSSTAIVGWKHVLEKTGKGFNFTILKAEPWVDKKED